MSIVVYADMRWMIWEPGFFLCNSALFLATFLHPQSLPFVCLSLLRDILRVQKLERWPKEVVLQCLTRMYRMKSALRSSNLSSLSDLKTQTAVSNLSKVEEL